MPLVRVAVFVDAGYLFAQGSIELSGAMAPRKSIELNQSTVIDRLKGLASETGSGHLLRIYWYDGVLPSGLSMEQQALADADDIKLKLGVVNQFGQQKGVDSLIVTDLVELARNHAISDAILLSGDEDVRIGVQIAQSFGVRVHLIGIGSTGTSQARTLMQEADTTSIWDENDIRGIMALKSGHEVPSVSPRLETDDEIEPVIDAVVEEVIESLSLAELRSISDLQVRQNVPRQYDVRLLGASRSKLDRHLDKSERHYLRERFKQAARDALASS